MSANVKPSSSSFAVQNAKTGAFLEFGLSRAKAREKVASLRKVGGAFRVVAGYKPDGKPGIAILLPVDGKSATIPTIGAPAAQETPAAKGKGKSRGKVANLSTAPQALPPKIVEAIAKDVKAAIATHVKTEKKARATKRTPSSTSKNAIRMRAVGRMYSDMRKELGDPKSLAKDTRIAFRVKWFKREGLQANGLPIEKGAK